MRPARELGQHIISAAIERIPLLCVLCAPAAICRLSANVTIGTVAYRQCIVDLYLIIM